MTYRLRVLIACLVLLSMTLVGAFFSYFTAERLQHHLERSRLAHSVLEGHLWLKAHTYELFKQIADAMLIGGSANHFNETELRRQLSGEIGQLRDLIASEVALVRDDTEEQQGERQELARLARIEGQVQAVLGEFDDVRRLIAAGDNRQAWLALHNVLERSIDQTFGELIEAASADEKEEVAETDEAARRIKQTLRSLAIALALLAVVVTGTALYSLLSRVRRPLDALVHGTARLSMGEFSHRLDVIGKDEFAHAAAGFNAMAEQLQRQHAALVEGREALERAVTERTAELADTNRALHAIDQGRRRFFADISHELRTPLTVMRGEAEVALRGTDKSIGEYKQTLVRIVEQAQHTTQLIDDLLFIARADAGETRMKMQDVALIDLLERVCDDARNLATAESLRIELQSLVEEAVISGDPVRLGQVFMILLDNAVHYSHAGGQILVRIVPGLKEVSVHVLDDGVGIPPDEMERVFERFYRGHGAERHHAQGSGLGLPIARAIVEAHNGTIALANRPEGGVEAVVRLPISRRLRIVA
jgi:signal transduction histidine kinase